MRVVSVHPARDPVACGCGPIRIGSATDDDIVLDGTGVSPQHVSMIADARGLVLAVAAGCRHVYVNARVVREQAVLHYGDTLTLGNHKLLVTTDTAPPEATGSMEPDESASAGPVLLRLVSGTGSGRGLAVRSELQLGAGTRHFGELAFACRIVRTVAGLVFESDGGAARVNGWCCRRTLLAANDQIALGEHRLVVEAPGQQYAAYMASLPQTRPQDAIDEVPVGTSDLPHTGIWWLIIAAAVLAAIIALFLYFHG